jgi:hypothetical protein
MTKTQLALERVIIELDSLRQIADRARNVLEEEKNDLRSSNLG